MFCGVISALPIKAASAGEIEVELLHVPRSASRYTDLNLKVRIVNRGADPIRDCGASEEKCFSLVWDITEEKRGTLNLLGKNTVPGLLYPGSYLASGEVLEKTLRIPTDTLPDHAAVLTVYAIVKNQGILSADMVRQKFIPSAPSPAVRAQRNTVRGLVFGYVGLTLLMLFYLVYRRTA